MTIVRFAYFCSCGDTMVGEVDPPSEEAGLEAAFGTIHRGEGHQRTDQRTARNARRRQRRAVAP